MLLIIRVSHCREQKRWDEFRTQDFDGAKQIIICGNPDLEERYKLEDDVLTLKCRDKWEDLPEKMIAAYSAILKMPEFEKYTCFMKIDSDIVPRRFEKKNIVQKSKSSHFFGTKLWTPPVNAHGVYHLRKGISKESPWYGKK